MSTLPELHQQPAWFGAVMGTGAVAVVAQLQATTLGIGWFTTVAVVVLWIASALAVILWPRYFRRLASRHQLHEEVSDPSHGAMLATVPAGLLVLAVAWGSVGSEAISELAAMWVNGVLTVIGTIIALVYSAFWAASISAREVPLPRINGGWLIPVVMTLLVPVALIPQIHYSPEFALPLLAVSLLFLGIGLLLFVAVFSLLVVRLATQEPLPPPMSPSLWIPLAPAGIFGVAIIRLTQSAINQNFVGSDFLYLALALSLMGIGFGLWWAVIALFDLRRAHRVSGIPFHMGWWGFVFPLAAMSLSITLTASALDFTVLLGVLASIITVAVWLVVSVRTIRAVLSHRKK